MARLQVFVNRVIVGALLGVAGLFLAIVAAIGYAYVTEDMALLPWVVTAWFTTEDGLPAMNFVPNALGMLGVIVVVATGYVFVASRSRKPRAILPDNVP